MKSSNGHCQSMDIRLRISTSFIHNTRLFGKRNKNIQVVIKIVNDYLQYFTLLDCTGSTQ